MHRIRERLRPFSHRPGTACLIPGTRTVIRAFPSRIEIGDEVRELKSGPFLIQQDLEKGLVKVGKEIFRGEGTPPTERLSLGSHKKQDWDLLMRRQDLKEILPLWFRLGQWTPEAKSEGPSLLEEGRFLEAFLSGFTGMMVPTGEDVHHYGFDLPAVAGDPFSLLTEGAKRIRALFFKESEALVFGTGKFHCGRMTGLKWSLGTLDYEWTKGKPRRVILACEKAGSVKCQFPSFIKRYRCRKKEVLDAGASFDVSAGDIVLLDRFEK